MLGEMSIPVFEALLNSSPTRMTYVMENKPVDAEKVSLEMTFETTPSVPPAVDENPRDGGDFALLTVNENYSCLLFDSGIDSSSPAKTNPVTREKRASTQTFFTDKRAGVVVGGESAGLL